MYQALLLNYVGYNKFWYPTGDGARWMTADDIVPVKSWVRLEYYFEENSVTDKRDGPSDISSISKQSR